MKSLFLFSLSLALIGVAATRVRAQSASMAERFEKPSGTQLAREEAGWSRTVLPVPDALVLEVSGITPVPGRRLMITTRRGEMWWVDGAYGASPIPKYTLFASGLHEALGVIPAPSGGFYVAQRQELTRVVDRDGDGRADKYETICKFPLSGSYHEFAFGPVMMPNGNLRVTLNNAYLAPTRSPVPWRGWMVEITPDGQMIPIAAGLRSPCGLAVTSTGLCLFAENQGEWIGSGYVTEVQRGDFLGHPGSLAWSKLPGSPISLRPADIPDSDAPMIEAAKRLPGMKTPTVWFPYSILGISTSGIAEDTTGGKFGPYAGQFFVGDQGQSKIMRMTLEQVKGVWQGAAYGFREGFDSGVIRLTFGEDGSLFVGETARGWGSVGGKLRGFERVNWTGQTPFEIKEVKAQPDGFLLTFTQPVDRATAENLASYTVTSFIYKYHNSYGSPPINRVTCPVRKVVVAPDGLSARIALVCLREGYIHEVHALGVRAAGGGEPLVHDTAYYTLNRIPDGERIIPIDPGEAELCRAPVPASANAPTAKHPTTHPANWKKADGDRTILLSTLPGLKFDTTDLSVKVGETLQLVFRNHDDMLHNFVLCAPGRGPAVGTAALSLGIDGAAKNYVPESDDVLVHTALLPPGETDRIFFTAPAAAGDYDFICSFPGHFTLMKGVLHVTAK